MTVLIRLFGVTAFAAVVCELVRRGPVASLVDFRALACILGGAAAGWFQIGRRGVLASGVLTYAVGIINMLSNIASPATVGWGLATALLSVVYAVLLSEFFFFPFATAASAGL